MQDALLLAPFLGALTRRQLCCCARRRRAETNAGEVEVRDALQAKADFLCSIGDRAAAVEAYAAAEAKTAGVGPKMDLAFSLIRWVGGRVGLDGILSGGWLALMGSYPVGGWAWGGPGAA